MSRMLILDIGAGTMDILYYDLKSGVHYKAVTKSPILVMEERVAALQGDLLITGTEMGGGRLSGLLQQRSRQAEVVMSRSASATINHNLEKVKNLGLKVVEDMEAESLKERGKYSHITFNDLDRGRLEEIIKGLGVPFLFDVVGICAQDHGIPPEGVSHLDYRHLIFRKHLNDNPFPHSMLYRNDEIPQTFNRLRSIAQSAQRLPIDEIYVMDSGMAAILGASLDPLARMKKRVLVMDIATSHTVGAALEGNEIAGFFEYHTHDITLERMEDLLGKLADGTLEHKKILEEGGHGAYIRKAFGFHAVEAMIATGPKRKLLEASRLPIAFGAPLGDNMMTGAVGVLEAIRRHKGDLNPISYL